MIIYKHNVRPFILCKRQAQNIYGIGVVKIYLSKRSILIIQNSKTVVISISVCSLDDPSLR